MSCFGGFDGDESAYQLLADGYMDACGVQNLFLEVDMAFQAFQDMWAGKKPEKLLLDPGFVITQANLKDQKPRRDVGLHRLENQERRQAVIPRRVPRPPAAARRFRSAQAEDMMHGSRPRRPTSRRAGDARPPGCGACSAVRVSGPGPDGALRRWPWRRSCPRSLTADTLADILRAMMPLLVVAVGQTFVLIVAGIDLSATSDHRHRQRARRLRDDPDGGRLSAGHRRSRSPRGIARLRRGRQCPDRLTQRRLRHPVQHAALHRDADHDDVLLAARAIWFTTLLTPDAQLASATCRRGFIFIGQGRIAGVPFSLLIALAGRASPPMSPSAARVYGRWLFAVGINPRAAAGLGRAGAAGRVLGLRDLRRLRRHRRPSSTPPGSRPARRCWASASCSTSSAPP